MYIGIDNFIGSLKNNTNIKYESIESSIEVNIRS